jgi:4-amino-4-deoxy-L-arabinose transferase-like glycosyltransferase
LGLLGIVLVFLMINAAWIWLFRHGQPLDIDEAGYLGISIVDYYGFMHDGIRGFLEAIWAPSTQAPLTTALAGLFYCITGPHVIVGFAVPLLSGTAIIVATYFLGCSLGSRQVGLVSAALVASCPIIITYSRSFMFALPTTAVVTMALVALLRSDRFRHFGWASVFGVCFGLMPLARTMTIAFVPGIVLGALIYTIAEPADQRRRLLVLALSLLLALATAASWLWPNGRYVFQYLLSFGYGDHAAEYGPSQSLFDVAKWLLMARIVVSYVHLPHFLVMLAGLLSMLLLAGRSIALKGVSAFLRVVASSTILPIIVYVAEAVAALASSQNQGDAFLAPIVPAAIVLSVWSCRKLSRGTVYRSTIATVAAAIVVLGVVPSFGLNLRIARP